MRVIDVTDGSHPRIADELPGSWWMIAAGSEHVVLLESMAYVLDLVPAQCDPASGITVTGIERPASFELWPNPAPGDGVTLRLDVDRGGPARLAIYDAAGRLVRRVLDGAFAPGVIRCRWDGRDESGRPAASGTYFARWSEAGRSESRRVIILR